MDTGTQGVLGYMLHCTGDRSTSVVPQLRHPYLTSNLGECGRVRKIKIALYAAYITSFNYGGLNLTVFPYFDPPLFLPAMIKTRWVNFQSSHCRVYGMIILMFPSYIETSLMNSLTRYLAVWAICSVLFCRVLETYITAPVADLVGGLGVCTLPLAWASTPPGIDAHPQVFLDSSYLSQDFYRY